MKRILLIAIFLYSYKALSQTVCPNSLTIDSKNAEKGKNNGTIRAIISGTGEFACKLNVVEGIGIKTIQETTGISSAEIYFKDLKPGDTYQVLVIFKQAKEIKCSRRQVSQIIISEQ